MTLGSQRRGISERMTQGCTAQVVTGHDARNTEDLIDDAREAAVGFMYA